MVDIFENESVDMDYMVKVKDQMICTSSPFFSPSKRSKKGMTKEEARKKRKEERKRELEERDKRMN